MYKGLFEHVIDSAFSYEEDVEVVGMPKVRLTRSRDEFFGGDDSKPFEVILEKPTPMDVLAAADKSIEVTQDFHHVFFEGVEEVESPDEIPTFRFSMGS